MPSWKRMLVCIMCAIMVAMAVPAPTFAKSVSPNQRARAAYSRKLKALRKDSYGSINYALADLTGDGVDEMIVQWWPAVYTYRGGKVVRVHAGEHGSMGYTKYYRTRKVVLHQDPDHAGSRTYIYLKWNGKSFVKVASSYTPTKQGRNFGFRAEYWVKGKGRVSKKVCKAYTKKLLANAPARKVSYKVYK